MSAVIEQIPETQVSAAILALPQEERAELFTIHDLEKLPENGWFRYELIGGEIIVSTAPRYIHQLVVSKLVRTIGNYLDQNPIGEVIAGPGLILSLYDSVIPDVIFISHQRRDEILQKKDDKLHGAPELVIEILSPGKTNARRDRVQKLETYEQFGVDEYWIINPKQGEIEIYRRGKKGLRLAKTLSETQEITTPLLPGFNLTLKKIF